jgi:hypothetical protein
LRRRFDYLFAQRQAVETRRAFGPRLLLAGHVPQALNAFEGVEAGMDRINHLNYVSTMMRPGRRRTRRDRRELGSGP